MSCSSSCSKLVYTISRHDPNPGIGHSVLLDKKLYQVLMQYKNSIHLAGTPKCWDAYKKQTNLYELIFTTSNSFPSLTSLTPHSRSFFKHWEMLCDFCEEMDIFNKPVVKCAFLAEGPGGFIEAFVRWRRIKCGMFKDDILFGATLISNDRMVPPWRFTRVFLEENNVNLLYGPKGDGSLYDMSNIDSFVNDIGAGECDYVTSDGGFDFSGNFNDQEQDSLMLIMCEIYTALRLQKPGGSFLLKLYDVSIPETRALLNILYESYNAITWVKPHTSRPANSEKYVLCTGFQGACREHLKALKTCIERKSYAALLDAVEPSVEFVEAIAMYNIVFSIKQIVQINLTLGQIRDKTDPWTSAKKQVEYALRWCHKYGVPISLKNLQYYACLKT